ncbi:hypothetical protein [Pseudodesulfovibrio piezophilus]|uniref:hypothetical protein n=1 Tax=Pseudodesulfovibrio piezophilus TaxID=879567 RepID=UPI000344A302|nr:hypothetical protein [Pseudodesulfovibrio piezophilus]
MDTLLIASIIVGAGTVLAFVLLCRTPKTRTTDRPSINIDFDTAKEREDKNRYFS